jgi:hypothetical protein
MKINRYIKTNAIVDQNNDLIPIWDNRLSYSKSNNEGTTITFNNRNYFNIIECIFDLKTKKLSFGIELDFYPDTTPYKIGDVILYELSHRKLTEAIVTDIVYEEYGLEITKGKNMEKWYVETFNKKNIIIEGDTLYCIKRWKPFYILNDGTKIEWDYKLYHKVK